MIWAVGISLVIIGAQNFLLCNELTLIVVWREGCPVCKNLWCYLSLVSLQNRCTKTRTAHLDSSANQPLNW